MTLSKRLDERKLKIDELVNSSTESLSLPFQREEYPCPVIKIAPEYLIYRLSNTRTKSAQKEYIADNNKQDDYFSEDRLEVSEVQDSQHEILLKFVDKQLANAFDQQGGQTEPILINKEGVIINGNRRLCFMRKENNYPLIKCLSLIHI